MQQTKQNNKHEGVTVIYENDMKTHEESTEQLRQEVLKLIDSVYQLYSVTNEDYSINANWKTGNYSIDMPQIKTTFNSYIPEYILMCNIENYDYEFYKNIDDENQRVNDPREFYKSELNTLNNAIEYREQDITRHKKEIKKLEIIKVPKPNKNGDYQKNIYFICIKHLIAIKNGTTITEQTEQGNKISDQAKSKKIPWLKAVFEKLNGNDETIIKALKDNSTSEIILLNEKIKKEEVHLNRINQKLKDLEKEIKEIEEIKNNN